MMLFLLPENAPPFGRRRQPRYSSCRLQVERLEDRTLLSYSSLVYPGADGNLIYTSDANGSQLLSLRVWSVMNIGDGYVDYGSREGNSAYRPVLEITLSGGSTPASAVGQCFSLTANPDLGQGMALIAATTPSQVWDKERSDAEGPNSMTVAQAVPVSASLAQQSGGVAFIVIPDLDGKIRVIPALPDPAASALLNVDRE
jgi:hypothetical protein